MHKHDGLYSRTPCGHSCVYKRAISITPEPSLLPRLTRDTCLGLPLSCLTVASGSLLLPWGIEMDSHSTYTVMFEVFHIIIFYFKHCLKFLLCRGFFIHFPHPPPLKSGILGKAQPAVDVQSIIATVLCLP